LRILVTGGAGFIGSHVVDRLADRGDEVAIVDDLSSGSEANLRPGVEFIRRDLADPGVIELIHAIRPEVVVHCAAQTSVTVSVREPSADARANIVGGVNTIVGADGCGVRRFIYVTTGGALYGNTDLPASEDHPVEPASPYGLSKWVLESYLAMLLPSAEARTVLRLANVYGPRQQPSGEAGVVSAFCDRMLRRQPVEIHGDGLQTRDFVFVADVSDAIVAAIDAREGIIANIGCGEAVTIRQLHASIAALLDCAEAPVHVAPRLGDIRHSILDSSRAHRILGWTARTGLLDGLVQTIEWHRSAMPGAITEA
jgi:UDP-glucose 4-epimerase